jgi:hypothetical protein
MSATIARLAYRLRYPLSAAIVIGFLFMAPNLAITSIDND